MSRALVFTRKGLFTVERGSAGWAVSAAAFVGDHVSAVLDDPRTGALYAALSHGHFGAKLHRSTDGGATWSELPAPVYPPKPEGLEDDKDPVRGTPTPWSLELVWALESGGASRPGRLWAGTVPGGLFRSDDGGESWQLMRGLWDHPDRRRWSGGGLDRPGMHSVAVDPRDPDRVLVAVSTGGVWITRDAGATWQVGGPGMRAEYLPPAQAGDPVTQDVHRLRLCPAAPDAVWVQHHNGIFRSTDGARSWREISGVQPSVFGFALAVHPRQPDTAWFVPAIKDERRVPAGGRLVVTRTRDGGQSFEALTTGLPQTWAYDLVYRHGLDVDGTGDRLLFGTTTGNLFATDDGGERWQAVSHHLPPIYGVRFLAGG